MKRTRTFQPTVNERLEDRVVLSGTSSTLIQVNFLVGGGTGSTGGIQVVTSSSSSAGSTGST